MRRNKPCLLRRTVRKPRRRDCTVAPLGDYVTLPGLPEVRDCRAVMHHYVAESKREYFRHNWARVLADAPGGVS